MMTRRVRWSVWDILGGLGVCFIGLGGCGKSPTPDETVAVDPAVQALAVEPLGTIEPDLGRETAIFTEPWTTQELEPPEATPVTEAPEAPSPAAEVANQAAQPDESALDMDDIENPVENSNFSGDPNN